MDQIPVIDMIETGKNIERLRKQNGLSVKDLQDKFSFSTPNAIYKWQKGQMLPTVDNLIVLASIFHVKVEDILVTEYQQNAKKDLTAT